MILPIEEADFREEFPNHDWEKFLVKSLEEQIHFLRYERFLRS